MKYKTLLIIVFFALTASAQNSNSQNKLNQIAEILQPELKNGVVHSTTPVGAIITSILDYDTFKKLNPNTYQNYVLCDGRRIDENSAYYKFSKIAPDLRGLFVRGVNKMDVNEKAKVADSQMNPENKKAGEFQKEDWISFKVISDNGSSYIHGPTDVPKTGWSDRTFYSGAGSLSSQSNAARLKFQWKKTVETETRPKNMSVYYYLKIN